MQLFSGNRCRMRAVNKLRVGIWTGSWDCPTLPVVNKIDSDGITHSHHKKWWYNVKVCIQGEVQICDRKPLQARLLFPSLIFTPQWLLAKVGQQQNVWLPRRHLSERLCLNSNDLQFITQVVVSSYLSFHYCCSCYKFTINVVTNVPSIHFILLFKVYFLTYFTRWSSERLNWIFLNIVGKPCDIW